ncbi:hypothetical protein CRG98_027826 [Punica granatum]|uniref:Uncharacterized protein n=1 Tax=Punica granatum TaxID=22663 RepID=A0A2I0J6B2_PUNGR|nr:hypothetical protein CRG98_027826 [Punica granatum]
MTLGCQGVEKPLANPLVLVQQEDSSRLPNWVVLSNCLYIFLADRVDPRLFSSNDHHGHLRGSLRSQEPPTLQQNTIGSHRCDVRPENCLVGSVPRRALFLVIFTGLYGSTPQLKN